MVNLLRTARDRAGLSQSGVAVLCGCSRVHYSDIERGKKPPSIQLFARIVAALCLSAREAVSLAQELAGLSLPTDTSAEPGLELAGLPLHLDGAPVELLALHPSADGCWTATVRPAGRPEATARRVAVAGLSLVSIPAARAA